MPSGKEAVHDPDKSRQPKERAQDTIPSSTFSSATTLLLFFFLLLALFPSLFHLVWTVPLRLFPSSSPSQIQNPYQQYPGHPAPVQTMWFQKQFTLPARSRGSYLITDIVLRELPEIRQYKIGLLHLFIQHTSCALSLNENWDEVRERL